MKAVTFIFLFSSAINFIASELFMTTLHRQWQPRNNLIILGQINATLPLSMGGGKVSIANITDDRFDVRSILTWENVNVINGNQQYIGFDDKKYASKWLRINFSIKFVNKVPNKSGSFGVSVFGMIYNSWVEKCKVGKWCDVSLKVLNTPSGKDNRVALTFNSIAKNQVIRFVNFEVQVMPENDTFVERKTIIDPTIVMMNRFKFTLPVYNAAGRMYLGGDDEIQDGSVITWENLSGKAGPWQWIGWKNRAFANKFLVIHFKIKFVKKVPPRSWNFGMKTFGVVHNQWVDECKADEWCDVTLEIQNRSKGDFNYVILIFDSIIGKQVIRFRDLSMKVL